MPRQTKPNNTEASCIEKKLHVLVRLIAAWMLEGKKQNERITVLSEAGLNANEIADIVGTTSATVRKQLSRARASAEIEKDDIVTKSGQTTGE